MSQHNAEHDKFSFNLGNSSKIKSHDFFFFCAFAFVLTNKVKLSTVGAACIVCTRTRACLYRISHKMSSIHIEEFPPKYYFCQLFQSKTPHTTCKIKMQRDTSTETQQNAKPHTKTLCWALKYKTQHAQDQAPPTPVTTDPCTSILSSMPVTAKMLRVPFTQYHIC